jgi:hypothetical protein
MTDGAAHVSGWRRTRVRFRFSLLGMMVVILIIGSGLGWLARMRTIRERQSIMQQEMETVCGEIALAEAELKRAYDWIVWSDRMFRKGYVSKAQNTADRLMVQQKAFALEQAKTKQSVIAQWISR